MFASVFIPKYGIYTLWTYEVKSLYSGHCPQYRGLLNIGMYILGVHIKSQLRFVVVLQFNDVIMSVMWLLQ